MCETGNGGMLYPLEANHKHFEDPKIDHLLQILEVSSARQWDLPCLFVRAARRGVSGISSRLDHRYLHPGIVSLSSANVVRAVPMPLPW
jgi:hypothetical protein